MSLPAAKKSVALRAGVKPSLSCGTSTQKAAPTDFAAYAEWQKAFLELRAVFSEYRSRKHAADALGVPKDPSTIASKQELADIAAAIVAKRLEGDFLARAESVEQKFSLALLERFDPALSVTEDSTLRASIVDRLTIEVARIKKLAKWIRDAADLRETEFKAQKTSGSLEDWLKTRLLVADFK